MKNVLAGRNRWAILVLALVALAAAPLGGYGQPARVLQDDGDQDDGDAARREHTAPAARQPVWLGVRVQQLDAALREAFDLERAGVLINAVVGESPAAEAGLRVGDIVTAVGGVTVGSTSALRMQIQRHGAGAVEIVFVRNGRERQVEAVLRPRGGSGTGGGSGGESGAGGEPEVDRERQRPPHRQRLELRSRDLEPAGFLGVRLAELDRHLAGYFGVEAGDGALIIRVVPGSPADEVGLRSGDIIQRLDGERVATPAAVEAAVRDRGPGETVTLHVIRHRRARDVDVELGERARTGSRGELAPEIDVDRWQALGQTLGRRLGEWRAQLDRHGLESRVEELERLVERLRDELGKLQQGLEQGSGADR